MKISGKHYRTIWREDDVSVLVIDQTKMPHHFTTTRLTQIEDAVDAIARMVVRGAPLIGMTAAYGVWLALREDPSDENLEHALTRLRATRPTAVNLQWALDRVNASVIESPRSDRASVACKTADALCDQDAEICSSIGDAGLPLIRELSAKKSGEVVNILTHCNAGWLATVDWGTALAPIYKAHDQGLSVHVWVDETRPRNQGAGLTAWELGQHGVPHTVIVDNAGGHLMQHGLVDMCIVGTDRTTRRGDVCNKIGTYLKALAAHDNGVPFYVALPESTVDWSLSDGVLEIPIEERSPEEVTHLAGQHDSGEIVRVRVTPKGAPAKNYGFDVTPARYVTGFVTEKGRCEANEEGLRQVFAR